MKHTILSLLMILLPMMAQAETVEINGIYYNLINKGKVAEVTSGSNQYTGNVVIPSSVVYNDVTYSVTTIGGGTFRECSGLTSVTIPNSVTSIEQYAFTSCSGLDSVTIPNSVTSIGDFAFRDCSSLTSITIPNSVKSIGYYAFYGCSSLTAVYITDLEAWCKINFRNTNSNPLLRAHHLYMNGIEIKDLVIPSSVTSINYYAFIGCSGLTSVNIPNSVTSIKGCAFCGCSGLTSVNIPNSITSISEGAFSGCSGLTSVNIPNSVTSIGDDAFGGCSSLTSVIIPNSVTRIGYGAFQDCSGLTSVTIGSGVKNIFSKAFGYCPELTDVYCYAESVPSTSFEAFDGSYIEHTTLHVPASAVNAYKNKALWSKFKEIVGIGKQDYTLTYMVDGTKYKEYSIGEGDNITPEPAPTKQGYTFSGWSAIPATMPANDVTVTGTFTKNAATTYMLIYMVDGQVYKTFNYAAGATVAQVVPPMKDGYTFSGWSNTLLTMPERNVTITGTFTKNVTPTPTPTPTYTLTYMVNGEVYKTVSYEYGEKITPEPEPTKEGATFSGWSWIPSKMPDEDVVVTGTFDMEKYKLTYKVDGADYKILEVEVGAAITPEPEPTKDGYTFSGWSWIPKKMPDEDVTITGTFTPSTGVETAVGSGRPFDVYTVTGHKVRSKVTSLKGLKKGVYIVEGKKVVVK